MTETMTRVTTKSLCRLAVCVVILGLCLYVGMKFHSTPTSTYPTFESPTPMPQSK